MNGLKRKASRGMTISMAQFRWAWRELYGRPFDSKTDGEMHAEAGTKMFREFGEAGINAAIAGYTFEKYVARTDV